jgi:cytochrome c peroxidase
MAVKVVLFLLFITLGYATYSEPITPLPQSIEYDKQKALLGKKLFFDSMLSKDGTVSCASCHDLQRGGVDNVKIAIGIKQRKGTFNTPTVYNTRYNFRQFWDGRAETLEDQVIQPIINPVEMGESIEVVLEKLKKSDYKQAFEEIYEDGVTVKNLSNVISEFEQALITPNAPFDRYLRGDKNAINKEEKLGYELFKAKGCISCHHGIGVGGNHFNKFGILQSFQSKQLGRYNVTHDEKDKYYFKVPSLRNVALTAPYFHDGRAKTLLEAVKMMSLYQLGRHMTQKELQAIVAFLMTLTGEIPSIAKQK